MKSTQLTITGEWATPNINEAMQLCVDASSKLGEIMRDCLKQAASASDERTYSRNYMDSGLYLSHSMKPVKLCLGEIDFRPNLIGPIYRI
ncbi:hypothetical protein DY000_02027417 [Brassica cretica]|uniref:Pectinesterase inhibitor domain-containing protein n=1 Tax=Brassica cretica TaxID=69181 RepID=A0ABQ7EBY7_BRACR|nr:hypothetical protein DY000_02027417 [Brassica cretica]